MFTGESLRALRHGREKRKFGTGKTRMNAETCASCGRAEELPRLGLQGRSQAYIRGNDRRSEGKGDMNIQIFGGGKNFDVKKAERYFKERRIPVQRVDLFEKGLSKGELRAVCRALGSAEALVDTGAKAKETVIWFQHTAEEDREAFLLEHPEIMRQPIVRNGAQATVGYQPEVWKNWA